MRFVITLIFTFLWFQLNAINFTEVWEDNSEQFQIAKQPLFIYGDHDFYDYIQRKINYSYFSGDVKSKQEVVILTNCNIQKNGDVTDAKVICGFNEKYNSEALKIVNATSKLWKAPVNELGDTLITNYTIAIPFLSLYEREAPERRRKYEAEIGEPTIDFSEVDAKFPGGSHSMTCFLNYFFKKKNIQRSERIDTKIIFQLTISKEGKIKKVKLKSNENKTLNKEALRLINLMPLWFPALHGGKPVSIYYNLEIPFVF